MVVTDYDRNGWPDLLAVGGDRPVLFANKNGTFTRSGALPNRDYPDLKSAIAFDSNGDGWQELLLIPHRGMPIFLRNNGGDFHRVDAGFDTKLQWGTGATVADFDHDGDLDVYIGQNGDWRKGVPRRGADGEATNGYLNLLYENVGTADDPKSGFDRIKSDVVEGSRWTLATTAVDFTNDGYPEIYVANDYGYDALLVNNGDMSFTRQQMPNTNQHGMATVVRDINRDGRMDLFVTNIRFESPQEVWEINSGLGVRNAGNSLMINQGNGSLVNKAAEYNVRQGMWGWGAAIEDFDNDGTLDILHATKYYLKASNGGRFHAIKTRPMLWERGDNASFNRRDSAAAGLNNSNGRGLATLDFDRDGDRDTVIADTSHQFKLYESVDDDGHWLQVHVRGDGQTAIGTRIQVVTDSGRTLTRVQTSRSNFFAQSTRVMHFGLGPDEVKQVRIVRPDGTEVVFDDVMTNRRLIVTADNTLQSMDPKSSGC
ncbi:MAG: CRTAC1 family protein [Halobacteriales archaeon]